MYNDLTQIEIGQWRQWIYTNDGEWVECKLEDFIVHMGRCVQASVVGNKYHASLHPGKGYKLADILEVNGEFEDGLPGIDLIEYLLEKFAIEQEDADRTKGA